MILTAVILMDLLTGMEFDLFVPSFPALQSHFDLTPFLVEASLSSNFIGFCLSLFFVGGLADHYGRKPIILLGLLIFIAGSLLCLGSFSYSLFLVGRFLQGIGIASPAVLSFLIIADAYPFKKQLVLMSMLNGVMNASVAAAPVLGSYITLYFHWEGNFMTLLLLAGVIFIMTIFFIPHHSLQENKEPIGLSGYIPLFKSKPLMLLIAYFVFLFVPYWIFVGTSPILYMEDLGVDLSHFGYYQGALAAVFALGSILFSFIITRYDHKKMLKISTQISILGLICVCVVSFLDIPNPLLITLSFIPFIIGQIIPSNLLYPLCVNFVPKAKGRITAIIDGARLIFSVLSLQVAAYFYAGSFRRIGIIIGLFIFLGIITLFFVVRNRQLMKIPRK